MRPPLRWVLWDVKDTLLRVRCSVGRQYSREAERLGLSLCPSQLEAAFRLAHRSFSLRFPNYGVAQGLSGEWWWGGVVRETFSRCRVSDPALLHTLSHNLYHNFCKAENWEVFPDVSEALESCSAAGWQQGVVSNFDSRLEAILGSCGLLPHFSFLVTSEGAGVAKPDPLIFNRALEKCGVPAGSVVHVGDHRRNDYLCARSVGIHGILLHRSREQTPGDVPAEHRLSSLDELPSWLQQHMD